MTFLERVSDETKMKLADSFVRWIMEIADVNKLPVDTIWELWQNYDKTCQGYDQSPTQNEFLDWLKSTRFLIAKKKF